MSNRYTLTTINGINTVIFPLSDISAIKVELLVRAGSRYETGPQWGAFHFLEHLTFQGTDKFPSRYHLDLYTQEHGLIDNAYTGEKRLGFWVKAPYKSIAPALEVINQLAFHPKFPSEAFPKELSVIEQEYHDLWDNFQTRFDTKLNQQIYGQKHPYSRDGIGQPEFVKTLTQEDIKNLHQKFFTGPNCYLAITGKLDTNKTISLVKKILQPISQKQPQLPTIPPRKTTKKIVHHEPVQQTRIYLSWPLPGFKQFTLSDNMRFSFAKYLLGGSTTSLLFRQIRERYGLAYHVGANRGFKDQAGFFEVYLSTDPKNKQKALKLLRQITYDFVNNPIDPQKFAQARNFMNNSTLISFDSISSINSKILDNLFDYNRIYLPSDYIKISNKITPQSTQKILQKYITPEKELLAIMESPPAKN